MLVIIVNKLLPSSFLHTNRDRLDRKLQAERTAEILANSTHPLVMLSYVTSKPYTPEYQRIVDHGNVQVLSQPQFY